MGFTKPGSKLLAEWFWVDRWDGSSAALLPMEARGLYREMLTAAWRRGGSLPNDHEAIQRAIRCTAGEWARSWPKIAPYWRVDDDRLVNDTQLEIYAEATERQERAHAKAMKAAAASPQVIARARAQAQAHGQARAEPEVSPPSPSPSPSLTPSPSQVGREVVVPSRPEPTRLPADIADESVRNEIRRLQNELGGRLAKLSEHDNSRDMVTAWCRRATSYTRRDGTKVPGVPDYRTISSIDRLEKSIADADRWLERLERGPLEETRGL